MREKLGERFPGREVSIRIDDRGEQIFVRIDGLAAELPFHRHELRRVELIVERVAIVVDSRDR